MVHLGYERCNTEEALEKIPDESLKAHGDKGTETLALAPSERILENMRAKKRFYRSIRPQTEP